MTTAIKFDKALLDKNHRIGEYVTNNYAQKILVWIIDSRYRKAVRFESWLGAQLAPDDDLTSFANSIPGATTYDELIMHVLQAVRANVTYVSDDKNPYHPATEYWQTAKETLKERVGDCEDGAVLAYITARRKGIPAERLMLWTGWVSAQGQPNNQAGHCCLLYRPDEYPLCWAFMDWCYHQSDAPIDRNRTLYLIQDQAVFSCDNTGDGGASQYVSMWNAFNETTSVTSFSYVPNDET